MIVTCPSCDARFRVDPARLGPEGRRVRCSACGHRWLVRPEPEPERAAAVPVAERAPALSIVPPAEAEPGAAPELGPPPPLSAAPSLGAPPSGRGVAVAGWLVVVLLLLLLTGLVVGRNEIAAALPQMLPVYERLGLPVTGRLGLEIRNLASRRVQDQGLTIFVVEGEVHNLSSVERPVPPVRVALLDAERNELDSARFKAAQATLPAGAVTRFEARIVDPPPAARTFSVALDPGG